MVEAHKMSVVISAVDKASAPLKRITGGFNMLSKQGLMAGAMFAGVTMGIQAVMQGFQAMQQYIGDSVQSFREFTKTMSEVATMLDEIGMELLPDMTQQIGMMSIAFGKSANDLGRGLYQVLSAGVDSADAMMVLRNSAKLASATLTDVETAVDAVTTVLNAYGMSAYQSAAVTDIFAKTIIEGKVRMDELAAAIGYVVPIASQAGISFEEVSAAIATLSKQGINAQKASRGLRQVFTQLLNPSEEAVGAMVDMGIAYDELVIEGIGLEGVMQMINTATAGSVAETSRLIPNTQALSSALALNAQDGNLFSETLKEINSDLEATNKMYDKISKSPAFKAMQREMFGEQTKRLTGAAVEPGEKAKEDLINAFWIGITKPEPILAAESLLTPFAGLAAILEGGYKEIRRINEEGKKYTDETLDEQAIEAYTADFQKFNTIIDESNDLIRRLGISTQKIVDVEIPHLKQLKMISEQTNSYKTSLRWVNAALKDGTYAHYLHEDSTRSLVGSIRDYKNELDDLNSVQRGYNRETTENSLAAMRIQLSADRRRGRMTRFEKSQLKELGLANTELRIKQTENQLKMNEIQEKLSPAEAELERVRTSYQEQIFIIEDTYAREQKALQDQIDFKNLLLDQYEVSVNESYRNIEQATSSHMNAMKILFSRDPVLYHQVMRNVGSSGGATGGGSGITVRIEPININVANGMTPDQAAQMMQRALATGLVSGFTTVYG